MSDIPNGVCPYIAVKDASAAIEFYRQAFGASESFRLTDPESGKVGHAELQFADLTLMISDEFPDWDTVGPETLGGSPVKLYLRVDDADTVFASAIKHGATEIRPLNDEFYGDRSGTLKDPFGHTWMIASKIEDVAPEEVQRRWNEMMKGETN